jgi:hypothetical protein
MASNDQLHPTAPGLALPGARTADPVAEPEGPAVNSATRTVLMRWLIHDIPYIVMLLLALAGVVMRLPVVYWVILTPVFGAISIIEGWKKTTVKAERFGFVLRVLLDWCALLLAIYLLYSNGVQGVMNTNSSTLGMMLLLALGTFVAGIQSRVWQISAIGVVLFLAVPSVGWLDQSPLLLTTAFVVIVAIGGVTWWVLQLRPSTS